MQYFGEPEGRVKIQIMSIQCTDVTFIWINSTFSGNVFKVTSKQANLPGETTSGVFYMKMFNLSSIFKRVRIYILSKFDGATNFFKICTSYHTPE